MKIQNTTVESVPFAEIRITDKINGSGIYWLKLYWSQNSGIYGYQVCVEYSDYENYKTYKTNGCGYCKESQALQYVLSAILGYRAYSCHYDTRSLLNKYHKGGNYYKLSINQLKKACKETK